MPLSQKVYVVEVDCPDPYFGPNLDTIFATEELAKAYIATKKEWQQKEYTITEYEPITSLDEIKDK